MAEQSAEIDASVCDNYGCEGGRTHQGTSWSAGFAEEQWAPCGRPCKRPIPPEAGGAR